MSAYATTDEMIAMTGYKPLVWDEKAKSRWLEWLVSIREEVGFSLIPRLPDQLLPQEIEALKEIQRQFDFLVTSISLR